MYMKNTVKKNIENAETMIARGFIDRKKKTDAAVLEEKRKIIKECNGNVTPAYLYDYYVSIVNIPVWDLTNDFMIAKMLGLTPRKVADTRRLLTKLGWIRFDIHTHNNVRYGLWYIGKDVVAYRMGRDSSLKELRELGLVLDTEGPQDEKGEDNEK